MRRFSLRLFLLAAIITPAVVWWLLPVRAEDTPSWSPPVFSFRCNFVNYQPTNQGMLLSTSATLTVDPDPDHLDNWLLATEVAYPALGIDPPTPGEWRGLEFWEWDRMVADGDKIKLLFDVVYREMMPAGDDAQLPLPAHGSRCWVRFSACYFLPLLGPVPVLPSIVRTQFGA